MGAQGWLCTDVFKTLSILVAGSRERCSVPPDPVWTAKAGCCAGCRSVEVAALDVGGFFLRE